MQIVLTRPRAQSAAFAAALKAQYGDLSIVIAPTIEIVFLPIDVDFAAFDALVFTSQNGVRSYAKAKGPKGLRAYCVGSQTARLASEIGLEATSADGDITALNTLLLESACGAKLLHLSGRLSAGEVEGNVTKLESYEQRPLKPDVKLEALLMGEKPLVVPLFSSYAAKRFQALYGPPSKAKVTAVCMSESVADVLDNDRFAGMRARYEGILICPEPTRDAMIAEIGRAIGSQGA